MKKVIVFFMLISTYSFGQTANDYIISDNFNSYSTFPNTTFYSRSGHTGILNVAVGSGVLKSNTLGSRNVGLGHHSLFSNISGSENVAIGAGANEAGIGYANTSIISPNWQAIGNNSNVAVGFNSLNKNQHTNRNVAIGRNTLSEQIGLFTAPFSGVIFGDDNVAVGSDALKNSRTGAGNIAIGSEAMFSYNYQSSAISGYNISIGNKSMYLAGSTAFGVRENIAIGQKALYMTNGIGNVAIGNGALYNAGVSLYNIAIGENAGYYETGSNKLYIENSNSSTPLIGGDFTSNKVGINRLMTDLSAANQNFQVQGDALIMGILTVNATTYTSDVRFKKNILPLQNSLANILKINGVSYDWRKDDFKDRNFMDKKQIGLIAQEIEKIFPGMVETDINDYKSINYIQFIPVLVEALKELTHKVQCLESQNEKLMLMEKRFEKLETQNNSNLQPK